MMIKNAVRLTDDLCLELWQRQAHYLGKQDLLCLQLSD